jgi:hypothetical protein
LKFESLAAKAPEPENGSMDANTLAKHIVDQAIGDKPTKKKNPRASIRGTARVEALTPERLSEIGKAGAAVRWPVKIKTGE